VIKNLLNTAVNMCKTRKKTWFGRLFDKDDRSTALSSVIIFIILIVSVLLLIIPAFALGIEAWFNHTVASDITGWATYIGAVCSLIVTICGFKWGINNTDRKFPLQDPYEEQQFDQFDRHHHHFGQEQQINESEEATE